jgi:hypothetical protein
MKEAGEVRGATFVPSDEAARVLEPGKQPFDAPTASVTSEGPAVLRHVDPVSPMRCDQLDPAVGELAVEAVAVIGGIADQTTRIIGEEAGV